MNYKNILRLLPILLFSLTCDEITLPEDCLGIEGGTASMDECGVCDSDPNNDNLFPPTIEATDSTELIIGCMDCVGRVGGLHWYDECNVCDNYTQYGGVQPPFPYGGPEGCDCAGVLKGSATIDNCNNCICNEQDPLLGNGCKEIEPCQQDCNSEWGGDAVEDDCGVCGGEGSPNTGICDCGGVPNGDSIIDCTGECAGTSEFDCAGECGGTSILDECDVCDSNPTNDNTICVQDCMGIWDGDSVEDCAGLCNGISTLDNCGVCDDNHLNNCQQDCNSEWGGDAVEDDCGVCDGDGSSCNDEIMGCVDDDACNFNMDATFDNGSCTYPSPNYDCDGNCVVDEDCFGECAGSAHIDCSDECRGGNTGLTPYELCGCFEENADNYFCDIEGTSGCVGNGTNCADECKIGQPPNEISINPYTEDGLDVDDEYINEYYGFVYSNNCEYWGCNDETASNYDAETTDFFGNVLPGATNCEDGSSDSCCDYLFLYLDCNGVVNNSINIYITNSIEVGGFQFDIESQITEIISGNNGLASDNGFQVLGGGQRAIAFNIGGAIIPVSTNQLLTSLTLSNYNDGDALSLFNLVMSDINGEPLQFEVGDCYLDPTP